jgi:catechol 2,3-dioxygenase-like lactoylglutathione lyase family enzyme
MTVRRVVVDHVLFVVADLDASRALYTAALAPLGYEELYVQDDCVSYGAEGPGRLHDLPWGARDHSGARCVLRRG